MVRVGGGVAGIVRVKSILRFPLVRDVVAIAVGQDNERGVGAADGAKTDDVGGIGDDDAVKTGIARLHIREGKGAGGRGLRYVSQDHQKLPPLEIKGGRKTRDRYSEGDIISLNGRGGGGPRAYYPRC